MAIMKKLIQPGGLIAKWLWQDFELLEPLCSSKDATDEQNPFIGEIIRIFGSDQKMKKVSDPLGSMAS